MADFPFTRIGGMPITIEDLDGAARHMVNNAIAKRGKSEPPLYSTSSNGQVLSLCASDPDVMALYEEADIIQADGASLVIASRLFGKHALPGRVATTDLVHNTARLAQEKKVSFYYLGASQDEVEKAVANTKKLYPDLVFAGFRNGYFSPEEEEDVVAEINAVAPDILWVGIGVPLGQRFVARNRKKLVNVGVIKTCGGLFNFLSGKNKRAPEWMQAFGLEWVFRISQEPGRLLLRYLTTNPHAMWLLITRTG